MSIDDEIRAEKARIQADMRRKKEEQQLQKAMSDAGMYQTSAVVIFPPSELEPIIKETMSRMRFSNPKKTFKMPDGRVLVRPVGNIISGRQNESPDMYSFDAQIYTNGTGKGTITYSIWVFRNGAISLVKGGSNITWEELKSQGINAATVRTKIIEALASQELKKVSSGCGCYIATAVYGSYDCPEVWILRRYRDYFLSNSLLGRGFISIYYAVSPTLVKWFGNKTWFKKPWRKFLDKKVAALKKAGYSDDKYEDLL